MLIWATAVSTAAIIGPPNAAPGPVRGRKAPMNSWPSAGRGEIVVVVTAIVDVVVAD